MSRWHAAISFALDSAIARNRSFQANQLEITVPATKEQNKAEISIVVTGLRQLHRHNRIGRLMGLAVGQIAIRLQIDRRPGRCGALPGANQMDRPGS